MFQCIFEELITIAVWPKLERNVSKGFQMGMATFHLVKNIMYIITIYFEYYKHKLEGDQFTLWESLDMETIYLMYCAFLVFCGIASYILGFIQIFFPDLKWQFCQESQQDR